MRWKRVSNWLGAALACCAPATAQVTQRLSVSAGQLEGNGASSISMISADGRFVVFCSYASDLVPGDTNGCEDVFVRDLVAGTIERVSVSSAGAQANGTCTIPVISGDGRFVAFESAATNLCDGDVNDTWDIFLRDRLLGTTELVSVGPGGQFGDGESMEPSISPDGRCIGFQSYAGNLDPAHPAPGWSQIYVHDRLAGTTELVSRSDSGLTANGDCSYCRLSGDGRFVAFDTIASNLVPGDPLHTGKVYLSDRQAGTIERISDNAVGEPSNGTSGYAWVSSDARYVTYGSNGTNLVPGIDNGLFQVYLRDRTASTVTCVSITPNGTGWAGSCGAAGITPDGRYATFISGGAFVRDRQLGVTEQLSVGSGGQHPNGTSIITSLSDDGRFASFDSTATNLVPFDTNATRDVFVRDRALGSGTTAFASVCAPETDGVVACPCQNPPAAGGGCDNSAGTGGAVLTASGVTGVTTDGLVFRTSGEPPTALSVVAQGSAFLSAGAVYGQGVRCVGGSVKRLYTKTAVNGAISAPNLTNGDLPVSVRSAAKGDRILAGESRWYYVFYRDPTVLGGCPATSTFNATQAGRIDWFL